MSEIKAIYKIHNGSDGFDTVYFKTSYDQVGVDSTTRFLKPATHKVNGKSFYNSGDQGITLDGSDIKFTGTTTSLGNDTSLTNNETLNASLQKLAAGITAARSAIPSGVLTTSNYSTTLGSVYEAKFTDGSATIASVSSDVVTIKAGVSQSSGAIANNSSSDITLAKVAKTGAFSDLSDTGNAVTASSNLATNKIVVGKANNKTVETSTYSVSDIVEIAEGRTKTYITTLYTTNNKKYLCFGDETVTGEEVISNVSNLHTVEITSSTNSFELTDDYTYFYSVKYDNDNERYIVDGDASADIGSLKKGDIILITDLNYPDFWIYEDGNFFVSKLETTKQDLSPYLTAVSYDSSSHKIKYTKSSGDTDVVDLDNFASLNNSTGEISIGGVSKTPLYAHQSLTNYAPKASPTFTGTVTMPFSSAGFVTTNSSGVLSVDTTSYVPTTRTINSKALSSNISLTRSDVGANKVYCTGTEPSSAIENDIWIDTTNGEVTTYSTIYFKKSGIDGYVSYSVNDGTSTSIADNAEVTLTNVSKLVLTISSATYGAINIDTTEFKGYTSTGDIEKIELSSSTTDYDITQYLQEGCYVCAMPRE